MRVGANTTRRTSLRGQDGFTMLVTIGVLLVSSLLLAAAFAAADGDISLSHHSTTYRQAYYAAAAGIQEFEDELQKEPNYWEKCPELTKAVGSGSSPESYVVKPLAAEHQTGTQKYTKCETINPFVSMIEGVGAAAATDTFRIESTGKAGNPATEKASVQKIVATFKVAGFLNYVYFTRFEDEDPELYKTSSGCAGKYYGSRPSNCATIEFTEGDSVNGPMHTDDGADICGKVTFGRANHTPPDVIEMNHNYYGLNCKSEPTFNSEGKTPITTGAELLPPESDSSLKQYVLKEPKEDYEFTGLTHIVLKGETIEVTEYKQSPKTLAWPKNGLIYVKNSTTTACGFTFGSHYENAELDTEKEEVEEAGCGTVYVQGSYAKPLTIGAEHDVVINGNIVPSALAKAGETPPANDVATLGLIANEYVRVYHPLEECTTSRGSQTCKAGCTSSSQTCKDGKGSLEEPWIYAAILATKSSFIVDNYTKGEGSAKLGHLNVYGAIAQNYRGPVGQGGGNGTSTTGYLKNYDYDERLAVDEPPYFLQPLNAEWKVIRETEANTPAEPG